MLQLMLHVCWFFNLYLYLSYLISPEKLSLTCSQEGWEYVHPASIGAAVHRPIDRLLIPQRKRKEVPYSTSFTLVRPYLYNFLLEGSVFSACVDGDTHTQTHGHKHMQIYNVRIVKGGGESIESVYLYESLLCGTHFDS